MIPLGVARTWPPTGHGIVDEAADAVVGRRRATGLGLLLFAIAMNVPFTLLAATFDYPDVLRRGAADVLPRSSTRRPTASAIWCCRRTCARTS